MAHGYNLVIIPEEATYRPSPQQMTSLIKFLCERLEIMGEWSVGGEDELSNESAIDHLRAACPASAGATEAIASFQDLVSGSLFGYEQDSSEPDENYWADELRIYLTATPFPWCDWEYEEAACPACTQRFSQIGEILDEIRLTGDPVLCPCGAKTLPEDLKKSAGVNLASFAILFTGNRGWFYEVKNDRDAFKDEDFLATVEELLATKVQVVAVQH